MSPKRQLYFFTVLLPLKTWIMMTSITTALTTGHNNFFVQISLISSGSNHRATYDIHFWTAFNNIIQSTSCASLQIVIGGHARAARRLPPHTTQHSRTCTNLLRLPAVNRTTCVGLPLVGIIIWQYVVGGNATNYGRLLLVLLNTTNTSMKVEYVGEKGKSGMNN